MPNPLITRRGFALMALMALAAAPVRGGTGDEALVRDLGAALGRAARRNSGPATYVRIMERYADLQALGLSALGPWRQRLPRGRREAYFDAVSLYVARAAAQNARGFGTGDFRVLGSRDANVAAMLESPGGQRQRIAFRMSRQKDTRVRDVSVNGVWLGITLREVVVGRLNRTRGDFGDLVAFLATGSDFARRK